MLRKLVIASIVVMAIIAIAVMPISGAETTATEIPKELPVYKLTPPSTKSSDLATNVFGITGGKESKLEGRSVTEAEGKVLEVYDASGGVWFANRNQLWNPDAKVTLPEKEKALEIANSFLSKYNLQPTKGVLTLETLGVSGTKMATFDIAKGTRSDRQLDVQVNFGLRVTGGGLNIPVIGGGAKYNVVLGNGGEVIGYNGPRPGLEAVTEKSYEVVTREKAEATFKEMTKGSKIESYQSTLAYYIPPNMEDQSYMVPVYVFSGMTVVGDQKVPMRNIMIPATSFKKELYPGSEKLVAQTPRSSKLLLLDAKKLADVDEVASEMKTLAGDLEAGTSWIGVSGGLPGSQANAQGFVDGLRAAGWLIDFNWGDANAFESDWNANDDSWVDDADIVFYTGHADIHGWTLRPPNDGSFSDSEIGAVGGGRDIYGANDLEWVFIAACGPLEDDLLHAGGGDVMRWKGIFDGLHILCGYGAVTYDNTGEGQTLVRYMKEGKTVIDSWFRTGKEIQPATNTYAPPYGPEIYVGAMYAYKSGTTSPYNDHLHGYGSVAADPIDPNTYVCMWSPT